MRKYIQYGLCLLSLLFVVPVLYTFINSFMSPDQVGSDGLQWLPSAFNLQQYYSLVTDKSQYFSFMTNAILVVAAVIGFQLVFSVGAAFALAKLDIPYKKPLFLLLLLAILMPLQVTMVPNYLCFERFERLFSIHILNTKLALILPGAFSAFGVLMMMQFIEGIPDEVIEAARMEGAGTFRILFQIVMPMLKPGIHALIVLTFIDSWNLIEPALVFITNEKQWPLSAFLEQIYQTNHPIYYAGAVLYLVPAIYIFLKGERYLENGFTMGESDI